MFRDLAPVRKPPQAECLRSSSGSHLTPTARFSPPLLRRLLRDRLRLVLVLLGHASFRSARAAARHDFVGGGRDADFGLIERFQNFAADLSPWSPGKERSRAGDRSRFSGRLLGSGPSTDGPVAGSLKARNVRGRMVDFSVDAADPGSMRSRPWTRNPRYRS